jgi:L-ribulose-5-phosphate 3-epimerase
MSEFAQERPLIGTMQGRLVPPEPGRFQSFPRSRWRDEFALATAANLDSIEWIYDAFGADCNPLASDEGIAEIRSLCARHGVAVVSVCADYFMDRPIVHATSDGFADLVARLYWLFERCRRAGIRRMVLPFVDASKIETVEHEDRVLALLRDVLPVAERARVEVHLETALDPDATARLLGRLPHPFLKINYDAGNSASLGYKPPDELAKYGGRIGSVHVKDRLLGGGTVPLGTGSADLPSLFAGLRRLEYRGHYVLQAARGAAGDEVSLARRNLAFVRESIERAATATALS